jgi:serine/threonine-protein kinase SRK2
VPDASPLLPGRRSGYDGKKVDVWASGVLLFVMLLGMFPFEVEDENYQNTTGLYGIFMQQVGGAAVWGFAGSC